jgi:hypothetical protein
MPALMHICQGCRCLWLSHGKQGMVSLYMLWEGWDRGLRESWAT